VAGSGRVKIYLICPVRYSDFDASAIVLALEQDDQSDPTGIAICEQHAAAMLDADEVHIAWDSQSYGSHFDLGMAYVLGKPVKLIAALRTDVEGKSYLKVIRHIEAHR
jgi:nucleoside 2-deoxyribosyltransferase